MKALSIRQPWASMIARGEKTIETRTWRTDHRGDLLICASASPQTGMKANGPLGVAVCIVELVDCRPMTEADQLAACCETYPRAVAWVLRNVRPVAPIPVSGKLWLFDVDLDNPPAGEGSLFK